MVGIGLLGTVLTHVGLLGIISETIDIFTQWLVGCIGGCYGFVYGFIEFFAMFCNIPLAWLDWCVEVCIGIIPFI